MSAQHTPGPWKVYNRGDQITNTYARYRIEYETPDLRSVIADIEPKWLCPEHGDAQANAKLIAAAPDMAETLQGVLRVADRKTVEFDAVRAALAKAGVE